MAKNELASLEKRLAKFRAKHTEQCKAGKHELAAGATTQEIIRLLNLIVAKYPDWREK